MTDYEKCLLVLTQLFSRDFQFSLATAKDNIPSVRVVDTYYDNGAFWIVTYELSKKVNEITSNPNVALCSNLYSFHGKAYFAGHPLNEGNKDIRKKLMKAFEPWYLKHNNENDDHMCYVKFEPETGFFYKDGTGYRVNFIDREVTSFPFEPDTEVVG